MFIINVCLLQGLYLLRFTSKTNKIWNLPRGAQTSAYNWTCWSRSTVLVLLLGLDAALHATLQFYWVINPPCDLVIRSLYSVPPVCILSHCCTPSPLHTPTLHPPTHCGQARQYDLWHLNQWALKSLLNWTDEMARLDWQGDWMTGPEAKRDPEAVLLKCRHQHTGGCRAGGRVLTITGLTD